MVINAKGNKAKAECKLTSSISLMMSSQRGEVSSFCLVPIHFMLELFILCFVDNESELETSRFLAFLDF